MNSFVRHQVRLMRRKTVRFVFFYLKIIMRRIRIRRIGDINFDMKKSNTIKKFQHHRHHYVDFSGTIWRVMEFLRRIVRLEGVLTMDHNRIELLNDICLNKTNQFYLFNSID